MTRTCDVPRIAKLTRTEDAHRPELIPPFYDADVITLVEPALSSRGSNACPRTAA